MQQRLALQFWVGLGIHRAMVVAFCCLTTNAALAQNWPDTLAKYRALPASEAIVGFRAALKHPKLTDTSKIDIQVTLVNDFAQIGQTDSAEHYAHLAYNAAHQQPDTLRRIYATLSYSWTQRDRGKLESVLKLAQEARQMAEQIGHQAMQIYALNTAASVYYDLGNDSLQQQHLMEVTSIASANGLESAASPAMNNLAAIYVRQGKLAEAEALLWRVISIERQTNFREYNLVELAYGYLIEINQQQQHYQTCLQLCDTIYNIAAGYGLVEKRVLFSAMRAYYADLVGQQPDYQAVLDSLNAIDESQFPLDARRDFLEKKLALNAHFGRLQLALDYAQELRQFEDSLNNADLRHRVAYYREQFNNEQNEHQILQLESDKAVAQLQREKTQQRIIGLAIVLAVLAALLGLLLRLNQRLGRTKRELEELNAVKDRFFAIISHDLRNSVTAFDGIGAVIQSHIKRERWERLSSLGMQLDSEAARLNRFLNNLLQWALVQINKVPVNPKHIELRNEVEQQLAQFQHQLEHKNLTLRLDIPDSIRIFMDLDAFAMALRNTVGNAIKFSAQGQEIEINARSHEGQVELAIVDCGTGMDEATLNALFDLTQRNPATGTQNEQGTGIGLILVREVLSLNNATIKVSSAAGKGTTVTFVLPAKTA